MKKTPIEGKMASAYGKPLSELERKDKDNPDAIYEKFPKGHVIQYSTEYDKLETVEEVKAANEWPKDEDIIDFVNGKRIANAKQKQMQKEQDAAFLVKPTLENDANLQLQTIYKGLMASKRFTEAQAKALAAQNLGLDSWPEGL
jgi:hypothetical protein